MKITLINNLKQKLNGTFLILNIKNGLKNHEREEPKSLH